MTRSQKNNQQTFKIAETAKLPHLFILMAVYNEEKVIETKLKSIYNTIYPKDKLTLLIGSDSSTDATNNIVERYAQQYDRLHFQIFAARSGKIHILNQLFSQYQQMILEKDKAVLILTDANVFFTEELLYQLAKHYKNPEIGVVGANVLNIGVQNSGISFQEKWYIQRENKIKYYEGLLGGHMMGAFGACYALRADLFTPVPSNFIVDDFYLTLKAIEKNTKAIKELQAICYEDVSDNMFEEFRRKKRISAGNFQNLRTFAHLLNPLKGTIAFTFLSHKVLRWLGPFFLLTAFVCCCLLRQANYLYAVLFFVQIALLFVPLADYLLKKWNIHIKLFRFISYFGLMNIALLIGFFNYLKGIKSNVWKPTKRN